MALLAEAMRDGTAVRFHYRDQKGKETDRVFSPKTWEARHGVQCVKGYCHLRGSSRTFIVRRMPKVAAGEAIISHLAPVTQPHNCHRNG